MNTMILTIHQPYAHLIVTPQEELPPGQISKRVENRSIRTKHRGPLLIHAGKVKHFLPGSAFEDSKDLVFGAVVGMAMIEDCVECKSVPGGSFRSFWYQDLRRYPWLVGHKHAFGPICWILSNVVRFKEPIQYRGQQGIRVAPDRLVRNSQVQEALGATLTR